MLSIVLAIMGLIYMNFVLACPQLQAGQKEVIENILIGKSGCRQDINIDISRGENDPETFIPVSIIKGKTSGPTVLMVAGVHGFEFAPILAAQQLADQINPEALAGTLIIVRVAHVPSFEARSPYVNPHDRKNLNRSFPGKAKGTQTERIAHALSTQIIPLADIVYDVHSGDGAEWLDAFVGVYGGPLASDYPKALGVAQAFGFPNIVRYKMNTQKQIDTGRSLNRQAVAQGLPTVLIEIGENGQREDEHIAAIVQGVKNSLIHLGMIKGVVPYTRFEPRYLDGTQSVKASHPGIWHPTYTSGRTVKKGEEIGTIRSYSGELIETIYAPIEGYTLYGLAGPPVKAGEGVVTIGKLVTELKLLPAGS